MCAGFDMHGAGPTAAAEITELKESGIIERFLPNYLTKPFSLAK